MATTGKDLSETFQDFLGGVARFLMWVGGVASLVAIAFLIVTVVRMSDPSATASAAAAIKNVELFQKALAVGLLGLGIGASYLFWGEELLGALMLMFAAALYFAPLYVPMLLGSSGGGNEASARALGALQTGGMLFGGLSIFVLVIDISGRVKNRVKTGTKADQLKYGKGIKEESGVQNVFMGKCWQLPFCRKFVREKCPIFHAKRTCWRELVGCMCEEQVIRAAMENRPIPKDALLAGNMIPRNNKLNEAQKRERCKSCVIYNEHQRQKYKLSLPLVLGGFALVYALFHGPLVAGMESLVGSINRVVQIGTLSTGKGFAPPAAFVEMMLFVFFLIAISYSMKLLEYLIFKLKV